MKEQAREAIESIHDNIRTLKVLAEDASDPDFQALVRDLELPAVKGMRAIRRYHDISYA